MLDRIYYTLSEAEEILQTSRDGLKRLERAGLIVMHGENHGKRVTGKSLRDLECRIAEGDDIWAAVKRSESPAPSEPKPTAKGRSTKTSKAAGGTSPRQKTESVLSEFEPLQSKRPEWFKEIILPGESRA